MLKSIVYSQHAEAHGIRLDMCVAEPLIFQWIIRGAIYERL